MHEQRIKEPLFPAHTELTGRGQSRWRLMLGVLLSAAILVLGFANRAWLWEAIGLARAAQPTWLLLGLVMILSSFASRILTADSNGSSLLAPLLAAGVIVLLLGIIVLVLTRDAATLRGWLGRLHGLLVRTLGRPIEDTWADHATAEVVRVRTLVAALPRMLAALVLIQLTALSGHSLGLYLILCSLGFNGSFLTVLAAFGIALLTSTINVLPGGGGTVEAALVAVLTQLGVGAEAVPAAILFRLLNFWLMLPIAAGCYGWLTREQHSG
jgi:uncharacterized protein (TIRG00374 family)